MGVIGKITDTTRLWNGFAKHGNGLYGPWQPLVKLNQQSIRFLARQKVRHVQQLAGITGQRDVPWAHTKTQWTQKEMKSFDLIIRSAAM
jgi:hypothetical protein